MPHYVIHRDPRRFPFDTITRVQADSVDHSQPNALVFLRDEAVSYSLPSADVLELKSFETQLEAEAYIKEQRQWRSGRATVHVSESSGVAARPARRRGNKRTGGSAIPAEGIRIKTHSS